jgi:arabinose-5-phosphate isomerase
MGKAGIAMRKFSSTLCSLGFSSCYLHPGEASHGDLGILEDDDVLFVASTSGKTREVLEIIELAKNIGVKKIVGITSHFDSPIRDKVEICLDMGEIKEAGELGLAPTTSILVMSAITDSIALVASERNGLTKEEYSKYHHGGYLGKVARGDV